MIIARTRTESILDRSSPYNIIDTSTDDGEGDSSASSVTSATDIYMDAMDILDDERSGGKMPSFNDSNDDFLFS